MGRTKVYLKEYRIFLFLCALMVVNLIYMHYEVFIKNYIATAYCRSLFFCVVDVMLTVLFFHILTLGKRKVTFILSYCTLLFFATANILYSRFFSQYITFSVLAECHNLRGNWWLPYLHEAFNVSDLIFVGTTYLYVIALKKVGKSDLFSDIKMIFFTILTSFVIYIIPGTREECISLRSWEQISKWLEGFGLGNALIRPYRYIQEQTIFQNGILRGQIFCNIVVRSHNIELSKEEIEEISNYISEKNKKEKPLDDSAQVKGRPNLILILVESYISTASKIRVGGKTVTPNICNLIMEDGTYTNLEMQSQRGAGESSDAQVSYLTGLIPLPSELSISHIVNDSIVGLPRLMKEQKQYTTYITLPTPSYFWHQNELNEKYGINNIIDCVDKGNNWCDDEMLFCKLEKQKLTEPFINIVLTISMHGSYEGDMPYNKKIKTPFSYPKYYSKELCNYLDRCYYTDEQIGKYINHLKKNGIYEKSVIIITSDHQTKPNSLNMAVNDRDLPLIIVNSNIDPKHFRKGIINQIDLYPTLLDMFGIESEWRGFGHSILRGGYTNNISKKSKELSEKMMRGNYFFYK